MVIPIPFYPKDRIKAYLLCLNPIMRLKPREFELLEAMLKVYFNLKRSGMALNEIDKRLVDPMGRKVTRDLINMSEASHNNHFGQLKKKKVLTADDKLQDFLKNIDSGDLTISYKLNMKNPQVAKPIEKKETINEA